MSYFFQETLVPINDSLTINDGYLPIVINMFEPYSRVIRHKNGTCTLQGTFSDLIVNAARVAGLRIAVVNPTDIPYGIGTLNGEFESGTAFHYLKISAAFAFGSPAIAELDRWAAGDPMEALTEAYSLMTWIPPKEVDGFHLYKCLAPTVWWSLILSIVTLAFFCSAVENFYERRTLEVRPQMFLNYLWEFFYRVFPQEPSSRKEIWLRCILISFSLAVSVHFMAVLSSVLTSTLLVRDSPDTVDGYIDLLRFPRVRIFTEANSALHTMFLKPRTTLFTQLAPRVIPVRGIFNPTSEIFNLLNEVESRRAVIVCGSAQISALVKMVKRWRNGKCPRLKLARGKAGLLIANVFLSRNTPSKLRRNLRKGMRWTMEANLDGKATEWLTRDSADCLGVQEDPLEPLSLEKITAASILLLAGYVVSSLTCLTEAVRHRLKTSPTNTRTHNSADIDVILKSN